MAEASGDLDGEVELSLSLMQDARERSCSAGERDDSAGGVGIAGRKTDAGDARCRGETGSNAQEHAARALPRLSTALQIEVILHCHRHWLDAIW